MLSGRYLITDRTPLTDLERAMADGIEMIQVREKHLTAKELEAHIRLIQRLPNPHGTKILVNDRVDVALACGADGAHLRANSVAPAQWRAILPAGFLIGVSCHSRREMEAAEGADFVVLAPIFDVPGKGAPLGLRYLCEAVHAASVPVFALGGITPARIAVCRRSGAAGVAGIRLFQNQGG